MGSLTEVVSSHGPDPTRIFRQTSIFARRSGYCSLVTPKPRLVREMLAQAWTDSWKLEEISETHFQLRHGSVVSFIALEDAESASRYSLYKFAEYH